MAEKLRRGILKHYQKAVALGMILMMMATYITIAPVRAAGDAAIDISDTLADSRPGVSPEIVPNHTIRFKYGNDAAITNGDTQTVQFVGFTHGVGTTAVTDFAITSGATDAYGTSLTQTDDYTFSNSGGADPIFTFTWTTTGAAKINAKPFVQIVYTNATTKLPNPAAGTYNIILSGSGDYATGTTKVVILAGVTVSATIDAYLAFSVGDSDVGFGSWAGGNKDKHWATVDNSVATSDAGASAVVLSVATNGEYGVSISAKSVNAGLARNDGGSAYTIPADNSFNIATNTEGYGLYVTSAGVFTADTDWDNTDADTGVLTTTADIIATSTEEPMAATAVNVDLVAAISAVTPAGTYSDTLVFIATASY